MMGRRCLCFLLLALLAGAPLAFSQTGGSIEGVVKDSTGGALPGATVEVTNEQTGITRSVITDTEGRYRARDLGLGEYRVQATMSGFQTSVRRGVVLTIGREAGVDFQLGLGELSETVEVTGDAPLVNTSSSGVASLVSREQMADLPLNARDFSQLITLQAGTVQIPSGVAGGGNAAQAGGARISISGARPAANVFVLDGTEIQTAYGTIPAGVGGATLGLEAVQEFRVNSSTYSAQHGRSVGGTVIAATRSGTNQLRGTAYWYHRSDSFDAPNFFDRDGKPEFSRHQFGSGLGGPIVRNRTFFFGNLEHLRERLPQRLSGQTMTVAARQGIGIVPGRTVVIDPRVIPYLDLWPLPTEGGRDYGNGTAEYFRPASRPIDQTYASARVDHQFNSNSSAFARYTRDMSQLTSQSLIRLVDDTVESRNQYATIEYSKVLSSRLVNQTRIAMTRTMVGADLIEVNLPDPSLSFVEGRSFGSLSVSGISGPRVAPGFMGYDIADAAILADDATFSAGRHSIHFGGAFTLFKFDRFSGAREGGDWAWGSLVDFLEQKPPTRMRIMGAGSDPYRFYRQRLLSLYLQDDIRVNANLTMNVGMRYEFMSSPTETEGRLANLRDLRDPFPTVGSPYYENPGGFFSPRFGLAWDPTGAGRTSVRTGIGLFHQPLQMKDYVVSMTRQMPFWYDLDPPATLLAGLFPNLTPHMDRLTAEAPQGIHVFEFRPNNPYSIQSSFTVQQQLASNLVVEVGYTGTRGVHLTSRKHWDVPERVVVDGKTFFPASAPLLNPAFTRFHYYDTSAESWYHGLRATVTKRFAQGLHFQGAYTWSKTLDIVSSLVSGELSGNTAPNDPWDPKNSDWGLAAFHVGHVFTGSASYQLPWGKDLQGITGLLLSGWQVSGIFSARGGTPFTAGSNSQLTRNYHLSGDPRPDLVPGGDNNPVLGGPDQYFDPLQFVPQQPGFLGDLGRNTLVGPGMVKLDLSLVKELPLGGHRHLQVRAEAFNVLDRANFGDPSSGLFNNRGVRSPTAGQITSTSTTARQGQVAIRLTF